MATTLQPEASLENGSKPPATGSFQSNKPPESLSREWAATLPAQLPVIEADFAQLQDGSLVELVEDPNNPTRNLLLVWKDGNVE